MYPLLLSDKLSVTVNIFYGFAGSANELIRQLANNVFNRK